MGDAPSDRYRRKYNTSCVLNFSDSYTQVIRDHICNEGSHTYIPSIEILILFQKFKNQAPYLLHTLKMCVCDGADQNIEL